MKTVALHAFLGWCAEHNADMLFGLAGIETRKLKDRLAEIKVDRPVYVTGLARSGTTILLELLAENDAFASYRYMDFPLVMLPYWWNSFLAANTDRAQAPVERSHADGLEVTPESPEAMEEMLWMHFFSESHDPGVRNTLSGKRRYDDFDTFYAATIRKLLLVRGSDRYLAKNNYNIARLGYLSALFPDARFVIPVRDPLWHIASLMKQHRLLCEEEQKDRRILAYMRRCGHFEFGLDRRPLNVGSAETTRAVLQDWDQGREVAGWATYWADVHQHLLRTLESNAAIAERALIVSYERLCQDSAATLDRIYKHIEVTPAPALLERQTARLHAPAYYQPDFTDEELAVIRDKTADLHARVVNG